MIEYKRKWLRYIQEHISKYHDGRSSQIRDILYSDDSTIDKLDCKRLHNEYNDGYPKLLTLEQFIREDKLNSILD